MLHSFIERFIHFDITDARFIAELMISLYILYTGIKNRRFIITLLVVIQTAITLHFAFTTNDAISITHNFFIDRLSLTMALIVVVLSGLIIIYSIGYMKDYHKNNPDIKNRVPFFFGVIFIFIFAMVGLVTCNDIQWIFFCWEITTLSSFLLIGYSRTDEARRNSLLALEYNMWGGVAFALAISWLYKTTGVMELDKLIFMKDAGVMVPVALICFAGITKSAQYPFCKWLLGAMVAPTPVSALLHSSTMVKAGVYIILRFSYVLEGTISGDLVAGVGGLTFLLGSIIAISQSDAKRVLAYSTVANLGLIVLCAGIGNYEAIWAGMLLIIFHAVTKCLLFLCVGVVDDKLHSRNIEDMCGLIIEMPRISVMMQVGIAGMFLAPFGMLVSKWAVISAIVDSNPLFLIFIVFGSAATLFFWVKWMGKLTLIERPEDNVEKTMSNTLFYPMYMLTGLTFLLVLFLPLVSKIFVQPYIMEIYGVKKIMSHDNIVIMVIMLVLVFIFPLAFLHKSKKVRTTSPYLSGANVGGGTSYAGAMGVVHTMEMRDYYLEKYFGESVLYKIGVILSIVFIVGLFAVAIVPSLQGA